MASQRNYFKNNFKYLYTSTFQIYFFFNSKCMPHSPTLHQHSWWHMYNCVNWQWPRITPCNNSFRRVTALFAYQKHEKNSAAIVTGIWILYFDFLTVIHTLFGIKLTALAFNLTFHWQTYYLGPTKCSSYPEFCIIRRCSKVFKIF